MEDAAAREPSPRPRGRIGLRPSHTWFLLLAAAILALDQLTKWLIRASVERGDAMLDTGLLRIVHVTNSGAAFGLFQDAGMLLALTSIVGIVAILVYLFNPGFADPLMRLGLALMLGGAFGNLVDRLRAGEVVDFIKVPNWPAFNVADSAITVGVLVLLWTMLRNREDEPQEPANS